MSRRRLVRPELCANQPVSRVPDNSSLAAEDQGVELWEEDKFVMEVVARDGGIELTSVDIERVVGVCLSFIAGLLTSV